MEIRNRYPVFKATGIVGTVPGADAGTHALEVPVANTGTTLVFGFCYRYYRSTKIGRTYWYAMKNTGI
jgi:hypothetical protein